MTHGTIAIVLLSAAVVVVACADSALPEPLRRALESRSRERLRTAEIEFSITWEHLAPDAPANTAFYSWRCADGRYASTLRGDEHGVFARGPDLQPTIPELNRPWHMLVDGDETWHHVEDASGADVYDVSRRDMFDLFDLREAGLNPLGYSDTLEERLTAAGYPPPEYEATESNGLFIVTGRSRESAWRQVIDPSKDWSVIRTEILKPDGSVLGEFIYDVEHHAQDGVWFPSRIETVGYGDGHRKTMSVVQVLSAEFNRPDHDPELTPEDIGIEVGTHVSYQDERPMRVGYWDGGAAIPFEEYAARVEAGELAPGPTVTRAREAGRVLPQSRPLPESGGASSPNVDGVEAANQPRPLGQPMAAASAPAGAESFAARLARHDSEWEAYTRAFIQRFALHDEQAQASWSICRACQDDARAYLASRAESIRKVESLLRELPPADARREEAEARLQRLLAPIDRIFEQQLKPRLDRLPTRAQRRAAAASTGGERTPVAPATSAPADSKP